MRSVRARLVVGGTEAAGRLIDGPSLGPPAVTPDPPVVGGVGVDVEGAVEGRVVEVGARVDDDVLVDVCALEVGWLLVVGADDRASSTTAGGGSVGAPGLIPVGR